MAAIPRDLIESELFGMNAAAFTAPTPALWRLSRPKAGHCFS